MMSGALITLIRTSDSELSILSIKALPKMLLFVMASSYWPVCIVLFALACSSVRSGCSISRATVLFSSHRYLRMTSKLMKLEDRISFWSLWMRSWGAHETYIRRLRSVWCRWKFVSRKHSRHLLYSVKLHCRFHCRTPKTNLAERFMSFQSRTLLKQILRRFSSHFRAVLIAVSC